MNALTREDVPQFLSDEFDLDVKVRTLDYWRRNGKGPVYHKVEGGFVYYEKDLREWFKSTRVVPGDRETKRNTDDRPSSAALN